MSTTRALAGFLGVGIIASCFGLVGVAIGRRWFAGAPRSTRVLVDSVAGLAACTVVCLGLGSVGAFATVPLLVGSVIVGNVAARSIRAAGETMIIEPSTDISQSGRAAVVVAVAVVGVRWIAELLQTVNRGFSHTDELHYHLTDAAIFARTGGTWDIHFPSVGDAAAYHPANGPLLHAIGLEVLGSDFLSIFLNLGFAALALTAAWALGGRAGNPVAGMLFMAAFLCLGPATAEAGAALNDTMAIALLLAAAVLLIDATSSTGGSRHVALAGLAGGLAVGTKLTVLIPVVALVLVVLALPRAQRLRAGATYVGAALVSGGYWYLRNLVATGSPLPALRLGPLPSLDIPFQRSVEFPITDYLLDGPTWRDYFLPGFERVFGPLWPLLPGVAVAAAVLALAPRTWRTGRAWSLLAVAGLAGFAGYLVTPTSAGGLPGQPVLFALNLRYAFPAMLLCGFAALGHPVARRDPGAIVAIVAAVFVASNLEEIDPTRGIVAVGVVAVLGLVAWAWVRRPASRTAVAALTIAGLLGGGGVVQDRYLDRKWTENRPRWEAYEAMRGVRDVRIGITGYPQSYPFYGDDLGNDVFVLGDASTPDELAPFESCRDFWAAVSDDDLDAVAVLDDRGFADTPYGRLLVRAPTSWLLEADAPMVLDGRDVQVFAVREALPSCG